MPDFKPNAEVVEEWRVTGEPGPLYPGSEHRYPSYSFVWRSDEVRWRDAEVQAREFVALHEGGYAWEDGPHLHHRTVIYSDWEPADTTPIDPEGAA